ncbi:hypothetical protein ATCC90586_012131 [Pythium insidiosum]|nr:hypothetical protein ATCC90586_012131 [Pythium insidiosum]
MLTLRFTSDLACHKILSMVDLQLVVSLASALTIGWSIYGVISFLQRKSHGSKFQRQRAPWVPYWLPWIKHTMQAALTIDHMHDWTTELCEQYQGKPFRIGAVGQPDFTVISTPELFEDVLKTQFDSFDKGEKMNEALRDVLGRGIFAVDGHEWLRQRKTGSNLFTARSLRDSMSRTIQDLLPVLHRVLNRAATSGDAINLSSILQKFTLDAFTRIGFGCEFGCLDAATEHPFEAAFENAQRILTIRLFTPAFWWKTLRFLNIGVERELKEHIKVIDHTIFDIISRSLQARQQSHEAASSKNIVSLFIDNASNMSDEGGEGKESSIEASLLRDIVVNFLIAGRDTSAQVLSWLFVELTLHPEIEDRIREELRAKLPHLFTSSDCVAPSAEQVQRLSYLEAVIKETLRLHPTVPINSRRAARDTVLSDGTFIAAGEFVAMPTYALGRMTHVWGPDAREFRPERWLDETSPTGLITVSAFKFNSFHAGPRMCLGMNLAMLEMKTLAASVLSKFQLRVDAADRVTYDVALTLPIRGPLSTHIHRL